MTTRLGGGPNLLVDALVESGHFARVRLEAAVEDGVLGRGGQCVADALEGGVVEELHGVWWVPGCAGKWRVRWRCDDGSTRPARTCMQPGHTVDMQRGVHSMGHAWGARLACQTAHTLWVAAGGVETRNVTTKQEGRRKIAFPFLHLVQNTSSFAAGSARAASSLHAGCSHRWYDYVWHMRPTLAAQ